MEKEWLFGKTLGELAEVAASFGMPRFTATQIAAWIYRKGALSIDEMTNISLKNRRALEERYQVGRIPSAAVQQSADGTKKYLFSWQTCSPICSTCSIFAVPSGYHGSKTSS